MSDKAAQSRPGHSLSQHDQFVAAKKTDGRSPKTVVKYAAELKNFVEFLRATLGITTLQGLTPVVVDQYRAHRRNVDKLDL